MSIEHRASEALYLVWVNERLGLFDAALVAEIAELQEAIEASDIPARDFFLARLADASARAARIGSSRQLVH
jgi:hypothetical protein